MRCFVDFTDPKPSQKALNKRKAYCKCFMCLLVVNSWTQSRRIVYQVMECGNRRLLLGQCLPLFRCWELLLLGSTCDNALQCLPQGRMFVPPAHHSAVCCTAIHCANYCNTFRTRAVKWFKNPKKIKIYSLSTGFWSCFTKYETTKSKRWKQVY